MVMQTMRRSLTLVGSVVLAAGIGTAVFLRPKPLAREELPSPSYIPAAARQTLKGKMGRHGLQMEALVTRVILLDTDGVARTAGEVFDEPVLPRPIAGDELYGLLPERFFALQDEMHARARRLVAASAKRDRASVIDEFGGLARSCVACHQVYLFGADAP
jgi:hypothetical protein